MRIASLMMFALVACSHSPPITVRMSTPGELPAPAPSTAFDANLVDTCQLDGAYAPQVFDAVAKYARAHLVDKLDRFTGYPSGAPEVIRDRDERQHLPDGFATAIIISARARVGRVTVWQYERFHGYVTWGATIDYCIHVMRERGVMTIVLDQLLSVIG